MTDEAAASRRPATTEGADPQPPLPGEASSVRAHTAPGADQPTAAAPGADQNPDDQPTAEVPPVAEAPGSPVGSAAWVAGATSEPGAAGPGGTAAPGGTPPPGNTPPPPWGYGPPPGPPPPAGNGFAARYGLVRPRQGRYLAGVCAAIGRATNTDPVLWRVLLAVLGFFGGIGILVYVAAWLIIPAEGDTASPVESMLGRGRSSMSPVTVIILGVLVAVIFGFIVTDEFRAVLLGAAILIGGALLLNRNGAGAKPATGMPAPPGSAPAGGVPPAGSWSADPAQPAGTWSTAPAQPAGTWSGAPASGGGPASGHPAFSGPPGGPYPAPTSAEAGYPATHPPETPPSPYPAAPGPSSATPAPAGWPAATPPMPASAPPRGPFGPPPSGGYRPPFAPHGPYAGGPYPPGAAPAPPKPPKPPRPPKERSPLGGATFSMIFVAIGAVAVLDLTNAVRVGPSAYFAGALVTIALGLLVGTWFGRARWLIALGLAAVTALGISTLAESSDRIQNGSGGTAVWNPASYDAMAERYENTFGDATLDLRDIDFSNRDAQVTVQVNFGELTVLVPPDVDVTALADVNAGDARVFDDQWSGFEGQAREVTDLGDDGVGGGKLRLYLHVNAGDVEVTR